MTIEDAKTLRVELLTMTERLIAEFHGTPAGRVIAVVALCRRQLAAAGLRGVGLTYATESMARRKLGGVIAMPDSLDTPTGPPRSPEVSYPGHQQEFFAQQEPSGPRGCATLC